MVGTVRLCLDSETGGDILNGEKVKVHVSLCLDSETGGDILGSSYVLQNEEHRSFLSKRIYRHQSMICLGISSASTSLAGLPWMMKAFSHWALVM